MGQRAVFVRSLAQTSRAREDGPIAFAARPRRGMRRAAWAAGRMGTIERDWAVGEMLASCAMGMGRACTYGTEVPSLLPTGGPGVILCYLPAGACPGLVFLGVTVHVDGVWRGRRATCSRRGGGEGGEENGRRGKMVRSRRMGAGSHERNKVGEGMGTGAWGETTVRGPSRPSGWTMWTTPALLFPALSSALDAR